MSALSDLYQELILDHNRQPRNRGRLATADHAAEGFNPLCGDKIVIDLIVKDGVIDDVRFEGKGCAISTASASLMTEAIKGHTVAEAKALFERFHAMVMTGAADPDLGKLEAFSGVAQFPVRVKCATLAWHTLLAALDERRDVVSTE